MDYKRIEYILTPEELESKEVLVVGLGSGGAPVVQHMGMNGVRNWLLYDPDRLDVVNLVKHPAMRSELGELKVNIMEKWLLDRNPESRVKSCPEDVMQSPAFEEDVKAADIVISASDSMQVRQYVNRICVDNSTMCVTANVFRTGFGGEVFSYIPGKTGCFQCLLFISQKQGWHALDSSIDLLPEEEEHIYGLDEREFKASGLSMDIAIISSIAAKRALRLILRNPNPKFYPEDRSNYIIFYMRSISGYQAFSSDRYFISPQAQCFCAHLEEGEPD